MILQPLKEAETRQLALQWAVATAKNGEPQASIVGRAQAYLEFILYPLRPDVIQAAVELEELAQHAVASGGTLKTN